MYKIGVLLAVVLRFLTVFDSSRHRPRCFTPPAKDIFCVVMAVLASRPSSTRKPVHKPVRTSPPPRSGLSRSKSQFGRGGNTRAPRALLAGIQIWRGFRTPVEMEEWGIPLSPRCQSSSLEASRITTK